MFAITTQTSTPVTVVKSFLWFISIYQFDKWASLFDDSIIPEEQERYPVPLYSCVRTDKCRHWTRSLIVPTQTTFSQQRRNLINSKRLWAECNVDKISSEDCTVTMMDSCGTGVLVQWRGRGCWGGAGWDNILGYNYLEIMRLADLTAGPLPLSRQTKNKSTSFVLNLLTR